jgi:hypothetical protein
VGGARAEPTRRPDSRSGTALMARGLLRIAGAVLLGSSLAQAQTTREGLEAFARGDYSRAVQILKPIAESWPSRDHVAEFFMATMYDQGHGVTVDPVRACALYLRVSMDARGPFARPADELQRRLHGSLSFAEFQRCARLVNFGFNHGFEPATFVFEPGHWIRIEFDGATITYDGKEKPIDLVFGTGGAMFLPVEHTELTVGPSHSTRRHFLELFTWIPREPGRTWTLLWRVVEVVRDNVVPVISAELETVSGERPPDRFSLDARAVARLRVSDTGYAEWVISSGPKQGSGLIETEAERQERQAQSRARVGPRPRGLDECQRHAPAAGAPLFGRRRLRPYVGVRVVRRPNGSHHDPCRQGRPWFVGSAANVRSRHTAAGARCAGPRLSAAHPVVAVLY